METSEMNSPTQPQARSVREIIETKEFVQAMTMPTCKRLQECVDTPKAISSKQREWFNKWVGLQLFDEPQLLALERAAVSFAAEFGKEPKRGCLLLFFGNNGTGKTHVASALYQWARKCTGL